MADWALWICGWAGAVIYAAADAIMSCICDERTRQGAPPYRDFWHACLHVSRAGLTVFGLCLGLTWGGQSIVLAAISVATAFLLWRLIYCDEFDRAVWYRVDERVKLSTGVAWIDRLLGFHN